MLINSYLRMLRSVLSFEGTSLVILVFIAVPLKYGFDFPLATVIVGSIHGFLFVMTIYYLYKNVSEGIITVGQTCAYFILSLIPFGNIYSCQQIDSMINGWTR